MTQAFRLEAVQLQGVGVFDNTLIRFKPIESSYRNEALTEILSPGVGIADDTMTLFERIETVKCKEILAEMHLLTGPNGCGKSTLLYALAKIFAGTDVRESLIQRRFRNAESCVNFQFNGQAGLYGIKNLQVQNINFPSNQFGKFKWRQNDPDNEQVFGYGDNPILWTYKVDSQRFKPYTIPQNMSFSFAAFAYSDERTLHNESLTAIQELTNSPFESALSFENISGSKGMLQWVAINRTKSALAKADNDLAAAEYYDLALSRITELIKNICNLEVEFRLERSPLAVTLQVNGDNLPFDVLPAGLKSIISWVGDLSLRLETISWEVDRDVFAQPIILFLDEVDIHLHPKWQRRILPAIQKLLPNAQIFVTTHSPFVVGSVENAWVYRLPEPGTKTDGVMEIEGIPSGAGKSYRLILNEIFGIDKEFDIETEALFDDFYQARAVFLKTPTNADEVIKIAGQLADRGEEAAAIVSRELRQMSRVTGVEVSLA